MSDSNDSNQYRLTFIVPTEAAAKELDAAWRDIIAGKNRFRTFELAHDELAITESGGEQELLKWLGEYGLRPW